MKSRLRHQLEQHRFRSSSISLVLIAIFSLSNIVEASVYPFTDAGLNFEINDDDPFAPTVTFQDATFVVPTTPTQGTATQELITGTTTIPQPFPDPPLVVTTGVALTASIDNVSATEITTTGQTRNLVPSARPSIFDIDGPVFSSTTGTILLSGGWSIEGQTQTVSGSLNFSLSPMTGPSPEAIAIVIPRFG